MKRVLAAVTAICFLSSQAAFAAGSMSNVSQDISLQRAEINTNGGSSGGSAKIMGGLIGSVEKESGSVTMGKISNKGGEMKNVNQKINADKAKINANGASITIGEITNE